MPKMWCTYDDDGDIETYVSHDLAHSIRAAVEHFLAAGAPNANAKALLAYHAALDTVLCEAADYIRKSAYPPLDHPQIPEHSRAVAAYRGDSESPTMP